MKRILIIFGLAFLLMEASADEGGPGYKKIKKKCKVVQHGHKTSFKGRCDRLPPEPKPDY